MTSQRNKTFRPPLSEANNADYLIKTCQGLGYIVITGPSFAATGGRRENSLFLAIKRTENKH